MVSILRLLWFCFLAATIAFCQRSDTIPASNEINAGGHNGSKICGDPADIIFVLDASRSIWGPHFTKQLQFVRSLVNEFNIDGDGNGVRVGVLTFSDETQVKIEFNLGDHFDKDVLRRAISGIRQSLGGATYTHIGLRRVREEMLQRSVGARLGEVPQIVIVMTDGASSEEDDTKDEARRLKEETKARVISVGIGRYTNAEELEELASDPKDRNMFTVNSFDALETIKRDLAVQTCDVKKPDPPEEMDCHVNQTVDVAFVLGETTLSSVESALQTVEFVRNVSTRFPIGSHKIKMALVPAECDYPGFHFERFEDKESTIDHFNRYQPFGQSNGARLNYMRTTTFLTARGARPGVRKLGIVILTNKSEDVSATIEEAQRAKDAGIELIAVGIGDGVDPDELKAIASTTNRVFRLNEFNAFRLRLRKLLYKVICKGKTTPHPLVTHTVCYAVDITSPTTPGPGSTPVQ